MSMVAATDVLCSGLCVEGQGVSQPPSPATMGLTVEALWDPCVLQTAKSGYLKGFGGRWLTASVGSGRMGEAKVGTEDT